MTLVYPDLKSLQDGYQTATFSKETKEEVYSFIILLFIIIIIIHLLFFDSTMLSSKALTINE